MSSGEKPSNSSEYVKHVSPYDEDPYWDYSWSDIFDD